MSDARGEPGGFQPPQRRGLLLLGIGAAALVAIFLIGVAILGTGIARGTTVMGVDIGGMSREEAAATLEQSIGAQAGKPIRLRVADQAFEVDPAQAGLRFDVEATLDQADEASLNPISMIRGLFADRDLDPVVTVDEAALESALGDIALAVAKPAIEPSLSMDGRQPVLTPGTDGQGLDVPATADALRQELLGSGRAVAGTLTPVPPTVSAEAAKQARDLARAAVAAPVIVSTAESSARLKPKAIARALSFSAQEGALAPSLDGAVLYEAVADKLALVENPGRDASFEIVDGRPVVVPSKVGRGVSNEDLAAQVLTVLDKPEGEREVTVSIGRREPKLSTEQARELGVTELMSTFTQKFPYAAYRVQNIGQAARYVNGTLLMPGETFSMNDTIKERTEEHGYTIGFVVGPGGVFAEEMGGGVSAATTATWTAAFFAGMERVYTQAHSIYISRYQPGLEATVAWGIFDMKFRNDTPNAVYITATTTNTSMTVSFWGTKQYDEVKAEFGERRSVVPFETIYAKSKKNKKCLDQGGVDGFAIDVDRVFIKDGQEAKRETITTLYRPAPEVICDKEKPLEEFGGKPKPKPGSGSQPSAQPTVPADGSGEGAPEFG